MWRWLHVVVQVPTVAAVAPVQQPDASADEKPHPGHRHPRPLRAEDATTPCDAALLATEVARIRAWADFASDLLDAHIWGFSAGDWQAAEGLAHVLYGVAWPPEWKRDPEDATRIIVDPSVWPTY